MEVGRDVPFGELPLAGVRHSQDASVDVDFNTRWSINGQSEIPKGLFGLTTYKAGSGFTTVESFGRLKPLNLGMLMGTLIGGAAIKPPGDEKGEQAMLREVEERFVQSRIWKSGGRLPLQTAAKLGIDSVAYLMVDGWGVHHKLMPTDIDSCADMFARYIPLLKKHAPELEYVQITAESGGNISESALLRQGGYEDKTAPQYEGIVLRAVGEKLHKEFPDLKLLGPTNWGPPLGGPDAIDFVGHRFDDWTRPYLEEAWPQLHGFAYHSYFLGWTREQTGELQTLANFMQVRFGEQKPMYMTEGHVAGFEWFGSKTKHDDRAMWLYHGYHVLRALCFGVENCDRLKAMLWHDYGGWDDAEWATFRDRPKGLEPSEGLPEGSLDMATHLPTYAGLWLFRELRGGLVRTSTTKGVSVLASSRGTAGSVIILNGSLDRRNITVRLNPPGQAAIEAVELECVEAQDDFYRIVAGPLPADRWQRDGNTLTVQALPLAGYHVRVKFSQENEPGKTAGRVDYYGDKVMVKVHRYEPEGQIVIACPYKARRAKRVSLRIAYESLLLEPEELEWTFNGKPIVVDRRDYIEIPLRPGKLRKKNRLQFRLKDPQNRNDLRVRSATIVTEF